MPEGRFYEDYIEENKRKDKHRKLKKKINNRVVLLILVILLLAYLVAMNIHNRMIQKEQVLTVKTARSIENFEEKTLADGSKIKIDRITINKDKGIVYIVKTTGDGKEEQLVIELENVSENDNEITIKEEGLNIKVNLSQKSIEEQF